MFWNNWFKKKESKPNILDTTVHKFREIQTQDLQNVFSSDMSIYQVHVYVKNIVDYSKLLQKMIEALEHEKLLYANLLPHTVECVFKRDFYTDKNQHYVDPVVSTDEFIVLAIRLLTLYNEKERLPEKTFILEKNLLLIRNTIANLGVLSMEL